MNISFIFVRFLYAILSMLLFVSLATSNGVTETNLAIGISAGFGFALFLLLSEFYFKQTNLKALNTVVLGLFFGTLLGNTVVLFFGSVVNLMPGARSRLILHPAFICSPLILALF